LSKKVKLVITIEDAKIVENLLKYAFMHMDSDPSLGGDTKTWLLQEVESQITKVEEAIKEAEDV
jgi:hypothetical protein